MHINKLGMWKIMRDGQRLIYIALHYIVCIVFSVFVSHVAAWIYSLFHFHLCTLEEGHTVFRFSVRITSERLSALSPFICAHAGQIMMPVAVCSHINGDYVCAENKTRNLFVQNPQQGGSFSSCLFYRKPSTLPFVYLSECFSHCLRLLSDNLI